MTWKIAELPKVGSSERRMMLRITDTPQYDEDIKGSPFFSSEELRSIEEKHRDGITKAEIMNEVEKRLMMKWNTVKNYIQNDLVPRALRREKTEHGMISIYPASFIRHLNLVRYSLFSRKQSLLPIMKVLATRNTDDHTLIVAKSQDLGGGTSGDDCFHEFWIGNMRMDEGIGWINESIESAPILEENKEPYRNELKAIEEIRKQLEDKMVAFQNRLKSNKSPENAHVLDSLMSLLNRGGGKEVSS